MSLSTFHYVYETRADVMIDVHALLRTSSEHFAVPDVPAGTPISKVAEMMLRTWFESLRADIKNDLGEMEIIAHSIRTEGLQHLPALFQKDYEDTLLIALDQVTAQLGIRPLIDKREIVRLILIIANGTAYSYLRDPESVSEAHFGILLAGFDALFEPAGAQEA